MISESDLYMTKMETIVKENSKVHAQYNAKQRARIKGLRKIRAKQKRGEIVDVSELKQELQDAGIIDTNGNLTKHYR